MIFFASNFCVPMSPGRRRLQYIVRLIQPAGARPQNFNFENHCNGFWRKKKQIFTYFFSQFSDIFLCDFLLFFSPDFQIFFGHFSGFFFAPFYATLRRPVHHWPPGKGVPHAAWGAPLWWSCRLRFGRSATRRRTKPHRNGPGTP